MSEQDQSEKEAADKIVRPYRKYINETSALMSLLYDIDMLPEQVISEHRAICLASFCEVWKRMDAFAAREAALRGALEGLRREFDRSLQTIRSAYNEGFSAGMDENTKFNGGKLWIDSNAAMTFTVLQSALAASRATSSN